MLLWCSVVDGQRSCLVITSKTATHIISSSFSQGICGTKYQPWLIEALFGQRIIISLINFVKRNLTDAQKQPVSFWRYGTIIDKIGMQTTSIRANELSRETALYKSVGNVLTIYSNSERDNTNFSNIFILKLKGTYTICIYSSQNLYYTVCRQ